MSHENPFSFQCPVYILQSNESYLTTEDDDSLVWTNAEAAASFLNSIPPLADLSVVEISTDKELFDLLIAMTLDGIGRIIVDQCRPDQQAVRAIYVADMLAFLHGRLHGRLAA